MYQVPKGCCGRKGLDDSAKLQKTKLESWLESIEREHLAQLKNRLFFSPSSWKPGWLLWSHQLSWKTQCYLEAMLQKLDWMASDPRIPQKQSLIAFLSQIIGIQGSKLALYKSQLSINVPDSLDTSLERRKNGRSSSWIKPGLQKCNGKTQVRTHQSPLYMPTKQQPILFQGWIRERISESDVIRTFGGGKCQAFLADTDEWSKTSVC